MTAVTTQATTNEQRTCDRAGCNNSFTPTNRRHRYCSDNCRLRDWQYRNPFADLDRRLRDIEDRITALEERSGGRDVKEWLDRR